MPEIGYQRTWSANSTIPDSAAAGSAWACGEKFKNDVVCYRPDGTYPPTVLELAKRAGKATGLVATSTITHATPAVFGSHVPSRKCEKEIARQYVVETEVDVLLGDGRSKFNATTPDTCQAVANGADFIVDEAVPSGYAVVGTAAELAAAVDAKSPKLLGLFKDPVDGYASDGMTPEYLRSSANTEPHLADMATAALETLSRDRDGFFLMVEGSQVDWAGHANDLPYLLGEMAAFNDATRVVLDWVNASPARRAQTLVVVVADHETGGFAINGPYGSLSGAGDPLTAGWTSGNHTGVDTIVWSQGPGSAELGRALDNTDLYGVMLRAAKLGK
jgi:alkaline phosphatase